MGNNYWEFSKKEGTITGFLRPKNALLGVDNPVDNPQNRKLLGNNHWEVREQSLGK